MRRNRMMAALMQAMENSEPPSVLAYVAEYETDNHGLDVIRAALNYEVRKKIKYACTLGNCILCD